MSSTNLSLRGMAIETGLSSAIATALAVVDVDGKIELEKVAFEKVGLGRF